MRLWVRIVFLAALVLSEARLQAASTTRSRAVKRARDILAASNGIVTADEVAELQSELQETQAEDDTNEGIIEALLAKQKTLKGQVAKLQKERGTGFVQKKAFEASSSSSSSDVEDLRRQVSELTARADANGARADKAVKELVAARDTIARLQDKLADGEGHSPSEPGKRKSLSLVSAKLALLQSQDQDTNEQNGALATIQQFSRKMFMESQEVGEQMQQLNDRLATSQRREKADQVKLQEARKQITAMHEEEESLKEELASRAASSGQVKTSLTRSLSTVDEALLRGLQEVRSAEKALKAGSAVTTPSFLEKKSSETEEEEADLKDENTRLRRAGAEVMQKYDLLRQNCEKQQKWITAVQAQQRDAAAAASATTTTASPAVIADAH